MNNPMIAYTSTDSSNRISIEKIAEGQYSLRINAMTLPEVFTSVEKAIAFEADLNRLGIHRPKVAAVMPNSEPVKRKVSLGFQFPPANFGKVA